MDKKKLSATNFQSMQFSYHSLKSERFAQCETGNLLIEA